MKTLLLPLVVVAATAPAHAWINHTHTMERMTQLPVNEFDRAAIARHADEPDMGMDQNLPDSADPMNERKWMGGKTGPTSQGFRHQYFAGWRISNPITTFQIPFKAIGQAPNRVQETAEEARKLIRKGDREAYRRLAWSGHYLQDLAQPFHSVQIIHLGMVPWSALGKWPPTQSFENLVKETTRTISNYHWAYEGYVAHHLKGGAFDECLKNPSQATLKEPATPITAPDYPKQLALAVANASVGLASELGRAEIEKYGSRLKDPDVDLAHDKGSVEYTPRSEDLDRVTCKALSNAAKATKLLVQWALHP